MKRIIYLLIFVLSAAFFPDHSRAQDAEDRFKQQLQPIIRQVMEQRDIPGFAIAVVVDNKVVYAAGFGVRSLDNKSEKVTPQSLFHMASITKPFVATSVMQLVEKGKVDLDAPIVKYLPYFKLNDERYAMITVRQMLSHISGMPDVRDYEWDKPQYDDGALERYVRSLNNQSLIAAPGAGFRYSNMAYEVLGDLIAKVSGMTFEDYVKTNILEPLGMKSSTLLVKQASPSLLVSPHVMNNAYETAVSEVFPYNRMHSPSSTLYSNVLDMTRWAMTNMNRGELDGKRILKASTYDIMWKPAGDQWQQIGISWFLGKYREHRTISHSGGDTGFVSNLVMIPDRSIAVVMMSNFDRAPLRPLTNAALDVALGLKPEPIVFKPRIAQTLYKIIINEGIDSAVGKYRDLKKNQPDVYDFQEGELNDLGYRLIRQKKIKESIKVFQLNVEAYPASSNVYDSLGEAYMLNGDKAPAIENYEKALKLNPGNANAVEKLKSLNTQSQLIKEVENNWKRAKKWTLEYIDAMPENAVGFKPTPEVRSFSEQMLHLAFWNYGLVEAVGGKANPYGKSQESLEKRDDVKTKAALRKVVEESYDNVLAAIAGLDEAKLLAQIQFFNQKMTRLGVLAIALDHQTHHRGQTTIYLRLKGVTPPPEP